VTRRQEEDTGSSWMTSSKRECAGTWKRKVLISLSGELTLEEAINLS